MASNSIPKPGVVTHTIHEADFARRVDFVMAAVDLYHTYLLNYVRGLAGPHDAEDIVQELWKFVVVHFPEDKINCLPLLRRKAYQLFVDHYRRNVARGNLLEKAKHDIAPAPSQHPYDEADEDRFQKRFWEEFPVDLTDEQKKVLWHHARYGLTFAEIEAHFEISASTASDWVKLARKQLKKYLDEYKQ
jgi:RNA polymerase sigma factor (sigma-70 family)